MLLSVLMRLRGRFDRWMGALVGFGLGAFDTLLFELLGTEISLGGNDVTLLVCGAFTSSLVALGFLFGMTSEMRRREQRSSEALDRARAQMAQSEKLASLGQLASAIAHEVKNPLAIIRSSVQNLREGLPADDRDSHESASFAMGEIDRLTHVTNSLLAFARPISIVKSRVPCSSIVAKTEMLAARMLSDRSIALETDAAVEAAIEADGDLVCQVLLGLLGNAAEVTPSGGTIRLEGRALGEEVELAVADRGPGVPSELRDRIFEPFFTTRNAGTGLGLAVARQIVEAHEGKIDVEERDGGGARFIIRLRRAA